MARRKRNYPPELESFARENYKEHTARQLAVLAEKELGIDITPEKMHNYLHNHGIRCGGNHGKKRPEDRITTPEIDFYIQENYRGTGPTEMASLVNRQFGTSYTAEQMKGYYKRNRLDSGVTGHFPKGHEPVHKGKKWDEYMSREAQEKSRQTTFKKGHVPANGGTPVGTIRLRSDGYYWEKAAQPDVWIPAHRMEWERHYGPVPEGCIVAFADGDHGNLDIENLVLMTRQQNAVINHSGIKVYDRESIEAAKLVADLKAAALKRKRERRKKNGRRRDERL